MPIRLKLVDHSRLLTDHLAEHIKDRTEKFGHFFDGVKECRVTVDAPGPQADKGRFRVRISLSVPDSQIAINRQTGADLPMAIRESFDAADERLADYVRISKDAASRGSRRSKRKSRGGAELEV
ncbi:MAG TPA: HPF/RaiA family ribosome-associated protein [Planctomycetota bacterium]|nr:HPF/RaiA family ribosome-associated protein [Planctomycetota bacterium]